MAFLSTGLRMTALLVYYDNVSFSNWVVDERQMPNISCKARDWLDERTGHQKEKHHPIGWCRSGEPFPS